MSNPIVSVAMKKKFITIRPQVVVGLQSFAERMMNNEPVDEEITEIRKEFEKLSGCETIGNLGYYAMFEHKDWNLMISRDENEFGWFFTNNLNMTKFHSNISYSGEDPDKFWAKGNNQMLVKKLIANGLQIFLEQLDYQVVAEHG